MPVPCIVHLDLKGAPWKVDLLEAIFPFMKANGATGVLLEWEDTFPYMGTLSVIGSIGGCSCDGMYSMDEVQFLLKCIKDNGMEPIQLVQSIGHMEYVLKHGKYQHLREVPHSPAVLCPSRPESITLVKDMVTQLILAQPDLNYIHIGGDEAWHMNLCADCQLRSRVNEHGAAILFLEHIRSIATFIKTAYPKVTVLMWDDMIRSYSVDIMKAFNMGKLVEPVVWNYSVKGAFHLDVHMWNRYKLVFPRVWAASAYKGANGSAQMVCSAQHYTSNQMAWRDELATYSGHIQFGGIFLTGWSRFDHYAALCELLPEALPSLVSCLRVWTLPDGCDAAGAGPDALPAAARGVCGAARSAAALRARASRFLDGDALTWLNPWQVEQNYTSQLHTQRIVADADRLVNEFALVRASLSAALLAATGPRSAEEFVATYLAPTEARVRALRGDAARAGAAVAVMPRAMKF